LGDGRGRRDLILILILDFYQERSFVLVAFGQQRSNFTQLFFGLLEQIDFLR
jgi:hypothetical protein